MKSLVKTSLLTFFLFLIHLTIQAQEVNNLENHDNKVSLKVGAGYLHPFISDDGVQYENSTYDPNIKFGFSYFASFDYSISKNLSIGIGFNGNYAKADFIRDAVINNQNINGYLEAGAVANSNLLLNFAYHSRKGEIQPFAQLGIGYFIQEVELGDVPLNLTNNVETEIFPDYKSSGLGILPELGINYSKLSLSVAYGLSFQELEGEMSTSGFMSNGTLKLQTLQINLGYRISLF